MLKRNEQIKHSYTTNEVMFEERIMVVILLYEQQFVGIFMTLFWALLYRYACKTDANKCDIPQTTKNSAAI